MKTGRRKQKTPSENLSNILVLTSTLNSHYSGKHKALRKLWSFIVLLVFKTFIFLSEN